jgi:hypothetical protein
MLSIALVCAAALVGNTYFLSAGVAPALGFYISLYVGLGSGVSVSCNAYVYAIRSTEYRAAFRKLFGYNVKVQQTNVGGVAIKFTKQIVLTAQMSAK